MDATNQREFERQLSRMEELIKAVEQIPDAQTREQTRELVSTLLDLHATGLERALDLVYENENGGATMIDKLAQDNVVSNLLILHGLHPLDLETRVRAALAKVKPRLGQHGGSVELIGVTPEGGVKLRLEGNCHGCPSSRVTLKSSIEEELYAAAPDITGLEVEGAVDQFVNATNGAQPKYTVCPTENGPKPTTGEIP